MFERITDPDDPNRCQSNDSRGQCQLKALEGSQYCQIHGGNRAVAKKELEEKKQYLANKFLNRAAELRENGALLSLTTELSYLKAILDRRFEMIRDEHSFVLNQASAADLIMKINTLVHSTVKLNDKLGSTLTADQALQFAQELQQIIAEELEGEALERVKSKIADCLAKW
jgi:hypothetical protein